MTAELAIRRGCKEVPEKFRCPACPYLETVWVLRKSIFPLFTTESGVPNLGIASSQAGESCNSSFKVVISKYVFPQHRALTSILSLRLAHTPCYVFCILCLQNVYAEGVR